MCPAGGQVAHRLPTGVDLGVDGAIVAAQVAVIAPLDTTLADHRSLGYPPVARQRELRGIDLAHSAQQLSGQLVQRVGAQEDLRRGHGLAELVLAFDQVVEHRLAGVDLQRHVGVGQQLAVPVHRARDRRRAHPDHAPEALIEQPAPRAIGRQVVRDQLDGDGRAAGDDHLAVAIDDVAARRLCGGGANAVGVGLLDVLIARQDLQVPEAEEDDPEQDQREAAEHGHAHGELRGDRRPAVVGLAVGRGRDHARESGLRPPVV